MKTIKRTLSILLAIVLLSCPLTATAFAQSSESFYKENEFVTVLDNGNRVIITSGSVASRTRTTIATKYTQARYVNSKNEVLCSFTIYGDFDTSTKKCVNAYCRTWTSGGSWRTEEPKAWRDTYKAYGSAVFVQRILGIKINSNAQNISVSYS